MLWNPKYMYYNQKLKHFNIKIKSFDEIYVFFFLNIQQLIVRITEKKYIQFLETNWE